MIKLIIEIAFLWLMYKFIKGFVIPVYRSTRQIRRQVKDVQEQVKNFQQQQQRQQQHYQQYQQNYHKRQEPVRPSGKSDDEGEYIDYEEVK